MGAETEHGTLPVMSRWLLHIVFYMHLIIYHYIISFHNDKIINIIVKLILHKWSLQDYVGQQLVV